MADQSLSAGEAFQQLIDDDPEFAESIKPTLAKFKSFAIAARIVGKEIENISPKAVWQSALDHTEIQEAQNQLRLAIEKHRRDFTDKYGELPPESIEDYIRTAVRAGLDAEYVRQGKWKPADLMPYVEGYLLRLRDNSMSQVDSNSVYNAVDESTSKKIKPKGRTVEIIRGIQDGKSNNEIVEANESTISNVRKVRSKLNNNLYEI